MTKKKGIPPLAIVGVGCLVLVIVAAIAFTVLLKRGVDYVKDVAENPAKLAEFAVKGDPNLEFLSSDDAKKTITFRDKRSGKESTISWDKVMEGKITVETDGQTTTVDGQGGTAITKGPDGTSTVGLGGLEKLPKWFEMPEGLSNWKSSTHTEKANGQVSGFIIGQSARPMNELVTAFEESLAAAGFQRQSKSEISDRVVLFYDAREKKRSLHITILRQKGKIAVTIGYGQK